MLWEGSSDAVIDRVGWGKKDDVLAKTPPPLLLNGAPNEFVASARTPQPAFAVVEMSQSVVPTSVAEIPSVDGSEDDIVHPVVVCSVTWLLV